MDFGYARIRAFIITRSQFMNVGDRGGATLADFCYIGD